MSGIWVPAFTIGPNGYPLFGPSIEELDRLVAAGYKLWFGGVSGSFWVPPPEKKP